MRKISELLPIVRQHLRTTTEDGEVYVCDAANRAHWFDGITCEERKTFGDALYAEMDSQSRSVQIYLYRLLYELGTLPVTIGVYDIEYIPHRDAWLDAWQTKLQGEQR